jgi:predicted ATPase
MAVDGRHLPAALFRIATRQPESGAEPDPAGTYARVTTRLSALTGVGVRQVLVDTDDMRELITLKLEEPDGVELPARSLSEGTLRFLALAVLAADPDAHGVICTEEPENGMHPANLGAMVDLLRDLAFDPDDATGADNPFRQVIANTHSPSLVQLLKPEELLFATADFAPRGNGEIARALRLAPLQGTWRDGRLGEPAVTKADILPYLTSPVGSQLSLDTVSA